MEYLDEVLERTEEKLVFPKDSEIHKEVGVKHNQLKTEIRYCNKYSISKSFTVNSFSYRIWKPQVF